MSVCWWERKSDNTGAHSPARVLPKFMQTVSDGMNKYLTDSSPVIIYPSLSNFYSCCKWIALTTFEKNNLEFLFLAGFIGIFFHNPKTKTEKSKNHSFNLIVFIVDSMFSTLRNARLPTNLARTRLRVSYIRQRDCLFSFLSTHTLTHSHICLCQCWHTTHRLWTFNLSVSVTECIYKHECDIRRKKNCSKV